MVTLGILVTDLHQEEDYFTTMAKASSTEDVHIFLFLPNDINRNKKTVKGKSYCHKTNKWQEDRSPLPMYIYDRCFYENEEIYKLHYAHVSWLKSQPDIYFLGHGLPNKWLVYNTLKEDPVINLFLPETELVTTSEIVFSMLTKHDSILLKPVSGSQGKGIFILANQDNGFSLIAKKNGIPFQKSLTKKQVPHLINKVTVKRKYLLQPCLQLTDNDQRPFDLRIFLQKNREGKWKEVGRGIRTGKIGDYTSNLGTGGVVSSYVEWLHTLPIDACQPLHVNLAALIERIPIVLEKQGQQLFEMGLDFGFANDGKLWLLEVNSKPGRKVITTSFPDKKEILARAPIDYCRYLDRKRKGVGV
jgi:hypothetical protein